MSSKKKSKNKIERTLVIIKPDGLAKSLTGNILTALSETKLIIVGAKIMKVPKKLAEKHYENLKKEKPKIFKEAVKYLCGHYHNTNRVMALVYQGEKAVSKIRKICGATNPEEAKPTTIRGKYGRINSKTQVFENVVHASDSIQQAKKEIKLWFKPNELARTKK